MNRRWVTGFGILGLGALALVTQGCSNSGGSEEPRIGTLSLPLATQSASGARYRLRDATFEIHGYLTYGNGGSGGLGTPAPPIVVNSEDDPDASAVSLSLEQGYYDIRLLPGWRMEKVEAGVATTVEATLLSSTTQYLYVYPQTTTWVEYEFGIGERSVWLNGNVNIGVRVYEDPSDRYGYGGVAGLPGVSGWTAGGSSAGGTAAGGAPAIP